MPGARHQLRPERASEPGSLSPRAPIPIHRTAAPSRGAKATRRCRITLQAPSGAGGLCTSAMSSKPPRPAASYTSFSMILTYLQERRRIIERTKRLREMTSPSSVARLGNFGA